MFKLFKKKVIEQEVQPSVKESVVNLKKDFKQFIKECDEHNKKMHEVCLQQLCDNAYLRGKAGIEIDFTKDTYRSYTDEEVESIKQKYHNGMFDILVERSEKSLNERFSKPLTDDEIEKLFELYERAKRDSRYHDYKGEFADYNILYNATEVVCTRVIKKSGE